MIVEEDIKYYNIRNDPFRVYGLHEYKNKGPFMRMSDSASRAVSTRIAILNKHTAGGRVRFKTDSRYIAIKAKMSALTIRSDMSIVGTSGFDLYINNGSTSEFQGIFRLPQDNFGRVSLPIKDGYESIIYFDNMRERDLIINFPLYNELDDLFIGLQESALVYKANDYSCDKTILFYGSSITQGICASRPGSCYTSILSRRLDCNHINLGFAGSALGEDNLVDYLSELNADIFVCDYDHNSPDLYHLETTHRKLYKKYRQKKPDVAIIFVLKPDFDKNKEIETQRRNIIKNTYRSARKSGDKNVFFIDGETLFKVNDRNYCTIDSIHPNDLGFARMADVIGEVIKKLI